MFIYFPSGDGTQIDIDQMRTVLDRRWYVRKFGPSKTLYVMASDGTLLHRLIVGAVKGQFTDHIDHNGLNNTQANLRLCTQAENSRNRRKNKNGRGPSKGVVVTKYGKYRASIKANKKRYDLGSFDHLEDAIRAYQIAASELHGEFCSF